MQCKDYKLSPNRDSVFSRLSTIWEETKKTSEWDNDIWRKGNTLQAVAQFYRSCADPTLAKLAMNIMLDGYKFYSDHKKIKWWVDDFGWWGGFFLTMIDYSSQFPFDPPFDRANLIEECKFVYSRMIENLDPQYGGIWNNPDLSANSCEKNTVTNSWMLIMAAGLANITLESQYRSMAIAQYTWLTTGQYNQYKPTSWRLYNPDGLVLWTPDGPYTHGPNFNLYPLTALWSGNEGVYLKGIQNFIGCMNDPNAKQTLIQEGANLISKAISKSTPNGFVDEQDVMHESPIAADWSNDLATGKGVALRFIVRFAETHNLVNDTLKDFVNATAQSVWCSQDNKGEANSVIARNWNPGFGPGEENIKETGGLWPQVLQTNGLDALNAAESLPQVTEESSMVTATAKK